MVVVVWWPASRCMWPPRSGREERRGRSFGHTRDARRRSTLCSSNSRSVHVRCGLSRGGRRRDGQCRRPGKRRVRGGLASLQLITWVLIRVRRAATTARATGEKLFGHSLTHRVCYSFASIGDWWSDELKYEIFRKYEYNTAGQQKELWERKLKIGYWELWPNHERKNWEWNGNTVNASNQWVFFACAQTVQDILVQRFYFY